MQVRNRPILPLQLNAKRKHEENELANTKKICTNQEFLKRRITNISKAMWRDFKQNMIECKPIADHFIPYGMFGGFLMSAKEPYASILMGATACVGAWRSFAVFEKEGKRVANEKLVKEQAAQLDTLKTEITRLNAKLNTAGI